MLSCSIWFSAPSFWMGGGLESRCVGRVYGADGAVHAPSTKNKLVKLACCIKLAFQVISTLYIYIYRERERWKCRRVCVCSEVCQHSKLHAFLKIASGVKNLTRAACKNEFPVYELTDFHLTRLI